MWAVYSREVRGEVAGRQPGYHPSPDSNTQQTKNETANVVVQQYSRILLKIGILMPETF